jgi:hypothetical protein
MEHLVYDLKEKLIMRRENEFNKVGKLEKEINKDLILISSGKFIELDFLINAIDELLKYNNQTKKLNK